MYLLVENEVEISSSPLTSGNIQYIFAFIILVLAGIIVYFNKQMDFLRNKIESLQESRLQDAIETGTKALETMQSFSQTVQLIENKLLISKKDH